MQDIEEIVMSSVRELCSTCTHATSCVYRGIATRAIIQCELFQQDTEAYYEDEVKGLCRNCDNYRRCNLPGKARGVWHCSEFV